MLGKSSYASSVPLWYDHTLLLSACIYGCDVTDKQMIIARVLFPPMTTAVRQRGGARKQAIAPASIPSLSRPIIFCLTSSKRVRRGKQSKQGWLLWPLPLDSYSSFIGSKRVMAPIHDATKKDELKEVMR